MSRQYSWTRHTAPGSPKGPFQYHRQGVIYSGCLRLNPRVSGPMIFLHLQPKQSNRLERLDFTISCSLDTKRKTCINLNRLRQLPHYEDISTQRDHDQKL